MSLGDRLQAAQELNRLLHRRFPEEAIFRMEHFLACPTIQDSLGPRSANRILEYAWNREQVERVDIIYWRIVEPILDAWRSLPSPEYPGVSGGTGTPA